MERKSAWSLPMTEQEIVKEYKEAKSPRTQIGILADQNGCEKKTIANILEAAGCEVPGWYKSKKKVLLEEDPEEPYKPPFVIEEAPEEAPDFAKVQPEPVKEEPKQEEEPLPIAVHVRLAALRAIENMLPDNSGVEAVDFTERVIGIMQLVKEAEHAEI